MLAIGFQQCDCAIFISLSVNLRILGRGLFSVARILLTKEALCGEQMWQFLVETVVGGHIDHIVPADVTG